MKIPMRVIPKPQAGTREILVSQSAGSIAVTGSEGSTTFVCGRCRDILAKTVDANSEFAHEYDPATDTFKPLYRVRDVVFHCKGCGAFNEIHTYPATV